MIKFGEKAVELPGIEKAYIGSTQVYGVPSAYRKLTGITFGAGTYYAITGFRLKGSDTVRISFSVTKACNVLGCYTTTSASTNYSLYVSTSSGSKYLRYDGQTYNSYFPSNALNTRKDVVISPTGSSGMPTNETWTERTFTAESDFCIGTTSAGATSSKLSGNVWGDVVVDGRFRGIPVERISDSKRGYYDLYTDTFYEPIGTNPTAIGYA